MPQARNKFPDLPETIEARLVAKKINGKICEILTVYDRPNEVVIF